MKKSQTHMCQQIQMSLYQGGKESFQLAQNAIDFILDNPESFDKKVIYNIEEVKVEAPVQKPRQNYLCWA